MTNRMIRKELRRRFHPAAWSLVVYYLIMNVAVVMFAYVASLVKAIAAAMEYGNDFNAVYHATVSAASDMSLLGWGYIITVALGLLLLLLWKKPAYFRRELLAKGRPMTFGAFAGLLAVFLGVQLVTSLLNTALEWLLNLMGLSMMAALESASNMTRGLSMFLYGSILAPITEELLFRGVVQRTLLPYGKKFAIFGSALLFGLFHGNLAQTPFAFMAGLVLGYVAAEYNLLWAMVLHMVNNLVLSDMMTRLTSGLSDELANAVLGLVILVCGIAGLVVLIVKRKAVAAYLRQEKMNRLCLQSFFTHPGVIILLLLTGLNGLLLIMPLKY